jgi:hypothetical protein
LLFYFEWLRPVKTSDGQKGGRSEPCKRQRTLSQQLAVVMCDQNIHGHKVRFLFSNVKWILQLSQVSTWICNLCLITPTNFFFILFLFSPPLPPPLFYHASVHFSGGFSLSQAKVNVSLLCLIQLCTRSEMYFPAHSHNCEKRLSPSSCLSICTEQVGSHSMKFHEIWGVEYFFFKLCREN